MSKRKDKEKSEEENSGVELNVLGKAKQLDLDEVRTRVKSKLKGPVVPVYIQFQDIGYKVESKVRTSMGVDVIVTRTILNNISGKVKPGEFLAIMGPTGAGKTTLLSILAGRYTKNVEGRVLINGDHPSRDYKRQNALVMQEDVLFANLTVHQTLRYQAELRLGNLRPEERHEKVDEIIDLLNLNKAKATPIGGPLRRGVSGGERKRVNIGNELLTNPSLIILDEPTTGLDTSTALNILQMLKGMTDSGYTIIASIHQPSSQMYALFDTLLVMVEGRGIYYGKADKAMDYFSDIGLQCEDFFNPADFMMGLIIQEEVSKHAGFSMKEDLTKAWIDYMEKKPSPFEIVDKKDKKVLEDCKSKEIEHGTPSYTINFPNQLSVLTRRSFFQEKGNRLTWVDAIQTVCVSIIVGLIWFQTPLTEAHINDRVGALFFVLVYNMFQSVFASIFTFPQEKAVTMRERKSGSYRLSAYYMAKTLSSLPFLLLWPSIVILITYFMIGFKLDAPAFFTFVFTIYTCAWCAEGIGICVSAAVAPNMRKALTVLSVIMLTFMLVGGFYIQSYPLWLDWIHWVSFLYPAVSCVIINDIQDTVWVRDTNSTAISLAANATLTGAEVLSLLNFEFTVVGYWLLILVGWAFFYRILGFLILQNAMKPTQ